VWGSPAHPRTITVNGHKIAGTSELGVALQRLRHDNEKRVLWVDALCINQKDDAEKIMQVGQMKHVFESAREVIVWIGDDSHASKAAELKNGLATYVSNFSGDDDNDKAVQRYLIQRDTRQTSYELLQKYILMKVLLANIFAGSMRYLLTGLTGRRFSNSSRSYGGIVYG